MIRILLYALVVYFIYLVIKSIGRSLLQPRQPHRSGHESADETDLIKDPECGAYFLKQRGVKARIHGKTLYFCSPSCRDAYKMRVGSR